MQAIHRNASLSRTKLHHLALWAVGVASLTWLPAALGASDANWPSKPITLVVPFAPGGTTDILARAVGQKMGGFLKQPVLIDNKAGAGGTLAAGITAKAAADGNTLFMATIAHTIAPGLYKSLNYDFTTDFDPIGMVAITPNVLIVNKNLPVKNVAELLQFIKASPNQVNYGSAGSGSTEHLASVLFAMLTGVNITHVPYKGGAPMMNDLMGGQIQMAIETSPSAYPQIKAGNVIALAVTTTKHSSAYPGVPTLDESGVKGYDFVTWFALMAPHATPPAIQARLVAELGKTLKDPKVVKDFEDQGVSPGSMAPTQLATFIKSETLKWGKVVKESGASAD